MVEETVKVLQFGIVQAKTINYEENAQKLGAIQNLRCRNKCNDFFRDVEIQTSKGKS